MKNLLLFCAVLSISLIASPKYSTTSVVTLVGAQIQSENIDQTDKKYKRKDCPVCKGKGWYISGDNIKKVDCGYCEPDEIKDDTTKIIFK